MTDETYSALSKDWKCVFKISLNGKPQTINNGTPTGGAAHVYYGVGGATQGFVDKRDADRGFDHGGAARGFGWWGRAQCLDGGEGAHQLKSWLVVKA